jgi:hypothetical protein
MPNYLVTDQSDEIVAREALDNGTDGSGNRIVRNVVAVEPGSSPIQLEGTVAHDAADSGNPVKIGGKASTSEPTAAGDGDRVDAWFDEHGAQVVRDIEAITADENGITVYGSDDGGTTARVLATDANGHAQIDVLTQPDVSQSTHDNLNANANLQVGDADVGASNRVPVAQEASSAFTSNALTNTATSVKASAGTVTGYHITNPDTAWVYIKVYDASNATVGTTTPLLDIGIPPETGAVVSGLEVACATAIEVAATANSGTSDTTAPAQSPVVNLTYR